MIVLFDSCLRRNDIMFSDERPENSRREGRNDLPFTALGELVGKNRGFAAVLDQEGVGPVLGSKHTGAVG